MTVIFQKNSHFQTKKEVNQTFSAFLIFVDIFLEMEQQDKKGSFILDWPKDVDISPLLDDLAEFYADPANAPSNAGGKEEKKKKPAPIVKKIQKEAKRQKYDKLKHFVLAKDGKQWDGHMDYTLSGFKYHNFKPRELVWYPEDWDQKEGQVTAWRLGRISRFVYQSDGTGCKFWEILLDPRAPAPNDGRMTTQMPGSWLAPHNSASKDLQTACPVWSSLQF
jgi:hypothetical protein